MTGHVPRRESMAAGRCEFLEDARFCRRDRSFPEAPVSHGTTQPGCIMLSTALVTFRGKKRRKAAIALGPSRTHPVGRAAVAGYDGKHPPAG